MQKWYEQPWLAFDFETTGTNPLTDRIVQAGVILADMHGAKLIESKIFIIDPGIEIPAAASALHGITNQTFQTVAHYKAQQGIAELSCYLFHLMQDYPSVVFNALYEWPMLCAECVRHKIINTMAKAPMFLDPMIIDRALDKYRKGKRTLETMAERYSVQPLQTHSALSDCCLALGVMWEIVQRFDQLKIYDLQALQQIQADWHREWRDHLREYYASQGKPCDMPSNAAWPDTPGERA